MRLVPAGVSKKTGRPYQAFYSCPNKCASTSPTQNYKYNVAGDKDLIILDEIKAINDRLDKLIAYVVQRLK
jgi:hypothetical protein